MALARIKAEREELRRREKARKERIQKRRDYLTMKADALAELEKMQKLRNALLVAAGVESSKEAKRIMQFLEELIEID